MGRLLLIIGLLTGWAFTAAAQRPDTVKVKSRADSLNRSRDSIKSKPFTLPKSKVKIYHPDSTHSPGLAFRRSLYIPAWGQVYNRSYWKVPLIYGGLGWIGYSIVSSRQDYKRYLAVYRFVNTATAPTKDDPNYDLYQTYKGASASALLDYAENFNRNFQISIISFAAVWFVQAGEAYIQAKFMHSYTMDDKLSFKVGPGFIAPPVYAATSISAFTPVLKVTITMR